MQGKTLLVKDAINKDGTYNFVFTDGNSDTANSLVPRNLGKKWLGNASKAGKWPCSVVGDLARVGLHDYYGNDGYRELQGIATLIAILFLCAGLPTFVE